jgi:hypothetical protein
VVTVGTAGTSCWAEALNALTKFRRNATHQWFGVFNLVRPLRHCAIVAHKQDIFKAYPHELNDHCLLSNQSAKRFYSRLAPRTK